MKLISWNVNSVRARLDNIEKYIKKYNPDLLFLQEIKTEENNFPREQFKKLGFESYIFGQKSYNGVAFLSKNKLENTSFDFVKDKRSQARVLSANLNYKKKKIFLINVYVPNGNPINTDKYIYKRDWLEIFINKIKLTLKNNSNIIIGGDFNIIPEEIDVYNHKKYEDDALFKIEIRKKFRELLNLGFVDIYRHLNKAKQEYTYWDYFAGSWQKNYGLRIDHFLISNSLINNISSVNINTNPRSKIKPSDHTPIEIKIT
tara:strand:- start:1660 stop:2436 length:777 start_codon:yes stop_codon:yes gene_type:complete